MEVIKVIKENRKFGRDIARYFSVTEGAIRKIINEKESMKLRIQQSSEAARKKTTRASIPKYPQLEQCIFQWLKASSLAGLIIPAYIRGQGP